MSTFSCQCQNYRGNLVVNEKEFYFTSSLFRIELDWGNVKRIRLETQQVKGLPTSVLTVVLQHNEAIRLQDTNNSSQRKRGSASRKYFFYGFQDLLGTEEMVKHYLEQYRTAEKAKEKEGRDDMDKRSSSTAKRPDKTTEKATEKDEVSSSETEALKEDSLNMSRVVVPRRPESEPSRTVAPLSFSGRRATPSSISRPRIPAKLLTPAPSSPEEEQRSRMTAIFMKVYRHVAVFLVLVMLFVLSRYFARATVVTDGRYATQSAEKLLRDVDALAAATAALESYDNQETLWRYNRGRKRLAELSHGYTRQLEATAVELMERYVAIQAKMTTLRGQRASRVARALQSGTIPPPPPPSMSSEFSTPKTAAATGVHLASAAAGKHNKGGSDTDDSNTLSDSETCSLAGQCQKKVAGKAKAAAAAAAAAIHQRKKKMSLSKLQDDVQRWVRRGKAAWAFFTRLSIAADSDAATLQPTASSSSSAHATNSLEARWVVYSEELGDNFHLTEWVSGAEDEDRHKCLSLTKELIDTLELTERVFATFTSVFLADRYRQVVSGEERGSYWLQPPQALRTLTNSRKAAEKKAFSGDAMARMALLRRFVASLVHDEPLLSNQAQRRAAALQVAEAVVRYRQSEVALLRTRNRGRTDNTTVLWRIFKDLVVAPTTLPLQGNAAVPDAATYLRNSVEELRFWHHHDSAWREHVLTFFTPEEQAEIRSTFSVVAAEVEAERGLVDLSTRPGAMRWHNLPLFRGLLCFETIPTLEEDTTKAAEAQGDAAEGDDEDGVDADVEASEDEDEGDERIEGRERGAPPSRAPKPQIADGVIVLPPPPSATNNSSTSGNSKTTAAATNQDEDAEAAEEEDGEDDEDEDASDATAAAAGTVAGGSATSSPQGPAKGTSTLPTDNSDLWKEVKLRWMADLEAFRLAFDPQLSSRSVRGARSYRLDVEDRSVVADAAEVRRHLFDLLALVNENYVRYMLPNVVQRFGSFLRSLFPPYSSARSGKDVYVSAVQGWGTQDPAVQLATAQVTGLAPGTTHDVSGSLLYLVLQPPPLLQMSTMSTRKTMAAAAVLILFTIVLAVLHFMQ